MSIPRSTPNPSSHEASRPRRASTIPPPSIPPDTGRIPPVPSASILDDLTRLAGHICRTPIAFMSLADQESHRLSSSIGLPDELVIGGGCPLIAAAMTSDDLFVVADASRDVILARSPLAADALGARFYAGVPLRTPGGGAFGTLSVMDRAPRELSPSQRKALLTLATQIVTQIELRLHIATLHEMAEERRRADAARAETDAALRSFFDGATRMVGVVEIVGDDIRHISENQATTAFFGCAPTVKPPELATDRGVPRDVLELWLEAYRECLRKRDHVKFEYTHPHETGQRWLSVVVSPLPSKPGAPPRCSYIVEDATERQRVLDELRTSQERLELALDSAQEGLWDLNVKTGAMDISERLMVMLGYTDGDVQQDRGAFMALIHPDDLPQIESAFAEHTAGRAPSAEAEMRMRCKDGSWRWLLTAGKIVLRDDDGAPLRIVGTHRDITERKRLAAAFAEARDQADDANRTKSMFLASMSHELRTPLNVILGYAEMLEEEAHAVGATSWLSDLARIRKSARHLLGLINDILDLSKIEAGKMTLHVSAFDLAGLAREVSAAAQPLVERGKHRFNVSLGDDLGVMQTDAARLRQCLLNLLDNAAKFTDAGVVSLEIERYHDLYGADLGAHWVRFTVTDTGVGMSPDQVSGLFQRVFQADSSPSRKYGGTGLGVALTQRLCRMMGGTIDVVSELGKGTSFTMRIPAVMPPDFASVPPKRELTEGDV